eukprot:Transcript_17762.p7 GENE.Transcript_17762~~Transcript_17762.p7  ORF type:complete len:84 (+),score=10.83 Transcript_17762:860-1111(+)
MGDAPPPNEACAIWRWTGANSYFMFSAKDHFAVGSGGHFALWLDSELLHGSSGTSHTPGRRSCRGPCLGAEREPTPTRAAAAP